MQQVGSARACQLLTATVSIIDEVLCWCELQHAAAFCSCNSRLAHASATCFLPQTRTWQPPAPITCLICCIIRRAQIANPSVPLSSLDLATN